MKKKNFSVFLPVGNILSKGQQKLIRGGDPFIGETDPEIKKPGVCKMPVCEVQGDCGANRVCTSFEFCSPQKHCF